MMQSSEVLLNEIQEEKKKVQIANIMEELQLHDHDLFVLTTLFLTLTKTRIPNIPEAVA